MKGDGVHPVIADGNRVGWIAVLGSVRNGPFETQGEAARSYKLVETILGGCSVGRNN